jgi:N-methylhydantoinase A/oxoprolinase/acetone carboxylase beta subunit
VGYRLTSEAIVFGGSTLTTTDIAVSAGRAQIGDSSLLPPEVHSIKQRADALIQQMVERCIDGMKLSADPVPVVLVGGGSILVSDQLAGASEVYRPEHFDVANAIGVAIAPISAQIDRVFSYERFSREAALEEAKGQAIEKAWQAGARRDSIEIVELEELAMAYMPGQATRIKVKAAGVLLTS